MCLCLRCVLMPIPLPSSPPPPPPSSIPPPPSFQSPTHTSQCPTSPFVRISPTSVPSSSPATANTAPTSLPPGSSSCPRASNCSLCTPTACSSQTHFSHVSRTKFVSCLILCALSPLQLSLSLSIDIPFLSSSFTLQPLHGLLPHRPSICQTFFSFLFILSSFSLSLSFFLLSLSSLTSFPHSPNRYSG